MFILAAHVKKMEMVLSATWSGNSKTKKMNPLLTMKIDQNSGHLRHNSRHNHRGQLSPQNFDLQRRQDHNRTNNQLQANQQDPLLAKFE